MRTEPHYAARAAALVMLVLGLCGAPAQAQTSNTFAIEMIVFANIDGDGQYDESWRAEPGLPDTSRASPASASAGASAVSPGSYRLSGVWQALRNSSQYRPLRHLAWTQRGRPQRSAPQILVGDDAGSGVYGTARVYRSRFLHLELDLLLRDGDGAYRFTSRRRMRSNELHYLDHPMFGVLIIATPLKG